MGSPAARGGGLGDAVTAGLGEHHLGRVDQPVGFPLQLLGGEKAGRDPQFGGQGVDRRLVGLEIDAGDAGHRQRRQRLGRHGVAHQGDQVLGGDAPLAADPQGQDRRMKHQFMVVGFDGAVGDADGKLALGREGEAGQPGGIAGLHLQGYRVLGQQGGGHRFGGGGIGQPPAGRRVVQGQPQGQFAGGGQRRTHPQRLADPPRQGIGAVMAAQQRHHRRAVHRHRQHRRLVPLMGQQRRHGADQNAGGADADDGDAGGEQAAQMIHGVGEGLVALDPTGQAVDAGAGQHRTQIVGGVQPGGADHHQGGGAARPAIGGA